ncbi:hypothetical protein WEN_02930 [Mycoplasma wenyonii str. Massachusetts]|uniref:Uncharacterized protein n=1 Tax=Mycoplasma wenyonii (strain Massachusetts) TaxID=1197325 RepID=I6YM45_MYCWM|nr:hypothetical protein [Mycoplasma wenyonii]AFN65369.1 hypothetical protein WEN_02930 [Mycoplasma wenyonii str. Massachusetts]
MAVSPAIKAFQIFFWLSSVATVPFEVKHVGKNINHLSGKGIRRVTYQQELPPIKVIKPANNSQVAMKKAVEILKDSEDGKNKEDRRGCFWMPKLPWVELFFCFNVDKLNSLFLFHFNSRARGQLEEKLNRIGSISVGREVTMNFVNGKNDSMSRSLKTNHLKTHLAWMNKWRTEFKPSKHCRITKLNENYTLTCNASSEGTAREAWTHNISHGEVHIPESAL